MIGGTTQRPRDQLRRGFAFRLSVGELPGADIVFPMSDPLIKIARDGKAIGEYSLADLGRALRAKTILPTDHYWRPGMSAWERVHFIATEAEAAIPREVSPPPPPAGSASSAEASVPARLYFVLGAVSIPVSAVIALMDVNDVRERMNIFQSLDASNIHKLKIAQAIEDVGAQQLETAFWFASLWAVARLGYYVLKGKTPPDDEAKIKSGRSLFATGLLCLLLAFCYSVATTSRAVWYANHSAQARHR